MTAALSIFVLKIRYVGCYSMATMECKQKQLL